MIRKQHEWIAGGVAKTATATQRVRVEAETRDSVEIPTLAEGSGTYAIPMGQVCVCCSDGDHVSAHPSMANVYMCGSCMERAFEPVDYDELGVGD